MDEVPGRGQELPHQRTTRSSPVSAAERLRMEAFSQFYRSDRIPLEAFLMFLGAERNAASDIAQEAMCFAFESWDQIQHPKAWVRRVGSRILWRLWLSVEDPSELIPERVPWGRPTDFDHIDTEQEFVRAVRSLPPRQRQVLAWTFEGFTPQEIAVELELPAATVRSNLKKARRAAAEQLERGRS